MQEIFYKFALSVGLIVLYILMLCIGSWIGNHSMHPDEEDFMIGMLWSSLGMAIFVIVYHVWR